MTFRDAAAEWSVGIATGEDSTRENTYHGDVELKDFFARPIQIANYTWVPGVAWSTQTITPWTEVLTNPRVANRMTNYKNLSAKLCVKFLVNGNSFYYGRLMAYYFPMQQNDISSVIVAGVPAKSLGSQRLKLFIDPAESQGGVMKLPFFFPFDKLDLTNGNDFGALGFIRIMALNELKHANDGIAPVSITVYAWLEDVKLSSPTAFDAPYLVAQAGGDEYGDGLVSAPASAVAKMTGKLGTAPMIGKYMKATSIAAGAMSSVAKMFGMSRPVEIEPPKLMMPKYTGTFALTDGSDSVAKLTVDSKQELTIDPSVTGVNGGDEMSLNHLASIESYITTFAWNVAYVPKTILFAARPCPQHYYSAGTPAYYTVPACAYVANAFKYWRGTMRYRFQVVSSGFHKGRLLIVWDPCAGATNPETNVQYSKIMDISNERDVTVEVGWGQNVTWLETNDLTNPYYSNNALTYTTLDTSKQTNGVLTVYVLNDLVTPNSVVNNDIQVNVFVSMCGDAQFAVPSDRIKTYSPYTQGVSPQAGGDLEIAPENNEPTIDEGTEKVAECVPTADASNLVYMGEQISSFRQLIRRYNLLMCTSIIGTSAAYLQWNTTDFPLSRGYYLDGLRAGASLRFNPVNTTIITYMAFAFTAFRGGIRNKIVPMSTATNANMAYTTVSRNIVPTVGTPTYTALSTTTAVTLEDQFLAVNPTGMEGMHVTPTGFQPFMEVEYPFYINARFVGCRRGYSTNPTYPMTNALTHKITAVLPSATQTTAIFVAAAEDATFSMFQGCIPFQVAPVFA